MSLTVSLAQIDITLGDPAANLAKAADWVAEAARRHSDLLILPELWSSGYALDQAGEIASPMDDGLVKSVSELAREHAVWISGSMLVKTGAQPNAFNRAILFDPHGEVNAVYDKIHLFGLMDEDRHLAPGGQLSLTETPWGKAGLAICYDLRFPEIFRSYALAGATMIILPSEWPYPRDKHWRTLLQARAIENQMFVLACNRVGSDANNTFCGHSAIIDPWGDIVVEGGSAETMLTATIDLASVAEIRGRIPVFRDRRPELYQIDAAPSLNERGTACP